VPNFRCCNIAIFVIFKMAAAAILDFQKFEILTVLESNLHDLAKFYENWSHGCGDTVI